MLDSALLIGDFNGTITGTEIRTTRSEPSTLTLLGIGAAALLVERNRARIFDDNQPVGRG